MPRDHHAYLRSTNTPRCVTEYMYTSDVPIMKTFEAFADGTAISTLNTDRFPNGNPLNSNAVKTNHHRLRDFQIGKRI